MKSFNELPNFASDANDHKVNPYPAPDWLQHHWIAEGKPFDKPNSYGITAMEACARCGDVDALCHVQFTHPNALSFVTPNNGESLLYIAVIYNKVAFCHYFLQNIDDKSEWIDCPTTRRGITPLQAAVRHRNLAVVRLLLVHGASLNHYSPRKYPLFDTAFTFLAANFVDSLRYWLVKMLDQKGGSEKKLAAAESHHSSMERETQDVSSWLSTQDFFVYDVISYLNPKECALLQAVSKPMRRIVQHRLDRYSILLHLTECALQNYQLQDAKKLLRSDKWRQHLFTFRAGMQRSGREYARILMSPEMFSLVYEF